MAVLVALCLVTAAASEDAAPSPESRDLIQSVEAEQAAVAAEIAQARKAPRDPAARAREELLGRLEHTLAFHLNELRRAEELKLQRQQAAQALESPPSAAHGDPPYSLDVYDAAREAAHEARAELLQLQDAVETARESRDRARADLETREKERRQAREEGVPDLERYVLQSRLAKAVLALRETELANAMALAETQRRRAERAAAVDAWVTQHLVVRPEDQLLAFDPFDREEATLRRRLERAELDLQEAKARWKAAQARFERGESGGAEMALLRTRLALRQREVALLGEGLDRLSADREIVRRRLATLGSPAPERAQLLRWLAEARASLEELDRARSLDLAEITTLEQELQDAERRASEPGAPAALENQRKALQARLDIHRANLADLDATRTLRQRFIEELEARAGGRTLRDRLAGFLQQSRAVWRYEIFSTGDQSVTVGKLVTAVSLIVLGLLLARHFARVFEGRILPRFGLDAGASHAFSSLGFYALLVVIFLISLRMVNIPLTAFALLGGAVAIGVGFGSQNVVNNFISGIILLAERPIKIGDLIQVEDTYGNVERIGLRSTRIRTGENIHFILPNSFLLENRVVNWTHKDARVRVKLNVGVVYGSPTREVEKLILQALEEHPKVLSNPRPIILFLNFGDNSLDFQANFWVAVRILMDRLAIESELRYRIDELFRAAGIVIAFPQRDVHLDAAEPLEIRLVNGPTPEAETPR